jgi:hypothetical protein
MISYREDLIGDETRIGVAVPNKPGYYDDYYVYDLSKLELAYLHASIVLKRFKYGLAVDAINSYPVYRLEKS